MVGSSIAHYKITAKLGQGGMGEVYLATDTKLDREVAIKALPQSFAEDKERVARFEREAKTLASLNHPNIGGIYGLEKSDQSKALVLELIEGEDLSERLKRGPLPVEKALEICKQIAEALEAAHEKGIIHRDLKPGNIKITGEGKVKVLDFGLAKGMTDETDSSSSTNDEDSPTLTAAFTQPGTILGTAAYMSPEQARGKHVDKRTDIWAFGCVLFECLSGKRAFRGDDVTDTLAAIIRGEPEWSALPENLPATIQLLLRKCLAKDRKQRLHDIADARIDIEEAIKDPNPSFFQSSAARPANSLQGAVSRARTAALGISAALMTAVLILVLGPFASQEFPQSRPANLHFSGPRGLATEFNTFAFTPSGDALIYNLDDLGSGGLFSRSLVNDQADMLIRGTERAICMFVKPDGRWIGYNTFLGSSLRIAPINGGSFRQLNPLNGIDPKNIWGGDWTEAGQIILAVNHEGKGLITIDEQGGDWIPLTELSEENEMHSWPQALPGGRYILFGSHSGGENPEGSIEVVEVSSRERKRLLTPRGAFTRARYVHTGHLLYHLDGNLFADSFDPTRLKLAGKPQLVITGVWSGKENYSAQFDVSARGDLVYLPDPGERKSQRGLFWLQTNEMIEPATVAKGDWESSRTVLSQDASRIALEIEHDVWIVDLGSGQPAERLTFGANLKTDPTWSLDDEWLYYVSDEENSQSLYRIRTDFSSNQSELVYQHESKDLTLLEITAFVPTGDGYVVTVETSNSAMKIMKLIRISGEFQLQPLVEPLIPDNNAVTFRDLGGDVSHDGHWIAFNSNRYGGIKVIVQRYDGEGTPRTLPIDGAMNPVWARDGNQLYVESRSGIYRVTFNTLGDNLEPHSFRSRKVMDLPPGVHLGHIEMSRGGDKAIFLAPSDEEMTQSGRYPTLTQRQTLKVIFDWATELDRLTMNEP